MILPARPRAYALVVLAALLAHLRSVTCGFVYDDPYAILGNPVVQGAFDPGLLLARDFWGLAPGEGVGTWRPLPVLTLWLDWHAGGGAPWLFHATNVLLHALASLALALAARSPLAGVIFAALAGSSEAVDGIVGRADVMAAGLCFLAWKLSRRSAWGAAAAFLGALLCKESAIVFPVWLLLVEKPRRGHLALAAAAGLYAALRAATFGLVSEDVLRSVNNNPLLGEPLGTRVMTSLELLALAARRILVPVELAPDYSFAEILPATGVSPVGALVLIAAAAGALLLRRQAPLAARGLAIFLVTWLAVSNIVAPLPAIFAERLLYLPAAGAAMAMAAGLDALAGRSRLAAIGLAVLLVSGNLARSVARAGDWRVELTVWAAAVETTPRSARAHANLGAALRKVGRHDEALVALATATEIAPAWGLPRTLAGAVLDDQGARAAAERQLRMAVTLDPDLEDAAFNLGLFLARRGRAPEAVHVLRVYAARHPRAVKVTRLLRDVEARLSTPR